MHIFFLSPIAIITLSSSSSSTFVYNSRITISHCAVTSGLLHTMGARVPRVSPHKLLSEKNSGVNKVRRCIGGEKIAVQVQDTNSENEMRTLSARGDRNISSGGDRRTSHTAIIRATDHDDDLGGG